MAVMRMKYRKGSILSKIKKYEVLKLKTINQNTFSQYMVTEINVKLKYINLLPLDDMLKDVKNLGIVVTIPFNKITQIKKSDNDLILYLVGNNNYHINEAIINSCKKKRVIRNANL